MALSGLEQILHVGVFAVGGVSSVIVGERSRTGERGDPGRRGGGVGGRPGVALALAVANSWWPSVHTVRSAVTEITANFAGVAV